MDSVARDPSVPAAPDAPAAAVDYAALAADAPLAEACFDVFGRLRLEDQLGALLERALGWTGARWAVAFGPGEEKDVFEVLAQHVRPGAAAVQVVAVDGGRLRRWGGAASHVVDGLGPFQELVTPGAEPTPQATLVLPVTAEGAPVAVVLLLAFDATPEPAVVARVSRFEQSVRPALLNGLQVHAIRELVIKDDTADCFNRRYFESTLPAELSRANRYHSPLSLIFLDMDNLKEVNKRHGHAMGSRTLLEVSQRIRSRIRRFDKLFRFGGDEFCIVLPETEWHGALEVAERVRDAIASRPFLQRELGDGQGARMTASLGIASFPLHARNQKDLIECADRAMQRIKNGTKNSIGIAEIVGGRHAG